MPRDEILTAKQVIEELSISPDTWYRWRSTGKAPRCFKLPNGQLRIRRSALNEWLDGLGAGGE